MTLSAGRFGEHAAPWDAIAAAGGYPPFLRSDFIVPALREFGTGRVILAVHGSGGRPVVMGLLSRKAPGIWKTFQPSQLPAFAAVAAITQKDPAIFVSPADSSRLRTLGYIETARVAVAGTFDNY